MTDEICAFTTPNPGGIICEVSRPQRIKSVLGDLILEASECNKLPMMLIYQNEDDTDEDDKLKVVEAAIRVARALRQFAPNKIRYNTISDVYIMGVESDELADEEKPNNEIEAKAVGALVHPERFAYSDVVERIFTDKQSKDI